MTAIFSIGYYFLICPLIDDTDLPADKLPRVLTDRFPYDVIQIVLLDHKVGSPFTQPDIVQRHLHILFDPDSSACSSRFSFVSSC